MQINRKIAQHYVFRSHKLKLPVAKRTPTATTTHLYTPPTADEKTPLTVLPNPAPAG